MTTPSDDAAGPELVPVPVRVVLPADPLLGTKPQEIVARLWKRRQTETGWAYLVGLPSYRVREDGGVEAAEYRVWVRAPKHVRPVDGVDYDHVVTEKLEPSPQSVVREVLGERRPSGWVLQKLRRGPAGGVLHAPDCEEAPQGAPLLDVEHALNVAENPATRLCNLCGWAQAGGGAGAVAQGVKRAEVWEDFDWVVWRLEVQDPQQLAGEDPDLDERTQETMTQLAAVVQPVQDVEAVALPAEARVFRWTAWATATSPRRPGQNLDYRARSDSAVGLPRPGARAGTVRLRRGASPGSLTR